ncbi:MAG: hypothetical protein COA89_02180, partial [Acidithiobacillus sp.]
MAINHLLFDLDGTLVDTAPDLVAALNFVLTTHGKPKVSLKDARCWAGAGSARLIEQGFSLSPAAKGFQILRDQLLDYYDQHVCEGSCLFPGIDQLLTRLEAAGHSWGIVTNKPARFTDPLLNALGLSHRAAVVVCGDTLPTNKPEPEPVLLDEILTEARQLRRDGEQRCSGVDDTVSRFVQSIQLRFAVGSPMSAEERSDERTGFECCEQFDRYRLAVG